MRSPVRLVIESDVRLIKSSINQSVTNGSELIHSILKSFRPSSQAMESTMAALILPVIASQELRLGLILKVLYISGTNGKLEIAHDQNLPQSLCQYRLCRFLEPRNQFSGSPSHPPGHYMSAGWTRFKMTFLHKWHGQTRHGPSRTIIAAILSRHDLTISYL